jgi:hypothetical protein
MRIKRKNGKCGRIFHLNSPGVTVRSKSVIAVKKSWYEVYGKNS